jgi:hypothetical protein
MAHQRVLNFEMLRLLGLSGAVGVVLFMAVIARSQAAGVASSSSMDPGMPCLLFNIIVSCTGLFRTDTSLPPMGKRAHKWEVLSLAVAAEAGRFTREGHSIRTRVPATIKLLRAIWELRISKPTTPSLHLLDWTPAVVDAVGLVDVDGAVDEELGEAIARLSDRRINDT